MKKLFSLLTIPAIATSVLAPLLANTTQERTKRDVSTLTSNSNNDYLPPTKINMSYFGDVDDVSSIMIDKQNNVYFGADKGAFVLKQGSTRLTKINGINSRVYSVAIDSKDNVYFGTRDNSAYVLKQGETTAERINGISEHVSSIASDNNNNNVYFGTSSGVYILNQGKITATKMNKINDDIKSIFIDKQDNVYFGVSNGTYKLSAGSNTKTKINGISENVSSIIIDKQNNVYFGTYEGVFVLKQGETTAERINGISEHVSSIVIDNNNNVYFGSDYGAFVLKRGSTTATKINGIFPWNNSVSVDSKDNVYFGTYEGVFVLKRGSTTVTPIKGSSKHVSSIAIDNNNNVYFGGDNRFNYITTVLDWVKQQSQFNLVDNNKTMIWTRPDLITVDGELNIAIANPNIDKVVFDNVEQPQTSKQWKINVKPETAPRDHNLQVFFTLGGKQYTSEIIVSMQAKIDPPKPIIKENLNKVIKFGNDNNLGNILDNNNKTITSTITQKNSLQVDFSQIEIIKKENNEATLSAKKDSKSYQGSVVVKYNVVPATIVDLKIDLQPTSPTTQVVKNYVGQIDTSTITSPVNTFYYANSESKITTLKPTASSFITGVVYGCDDKWNKTSQHNQIDPTTGIVLDGSQLGTSDGKYVVELSDNSFHTNNIYLQIAPKQAIPNYFDIPNGKQFEMWAKDNGKDNIRGYRANQLNKLFEESKNWQQSLKHLKPQLDPFVVENVQNVTQDEIDAYKIKLLVNIKSQVEKYVPDVVENIDYAINVDNLAVGDWTTSKDIKVQSVEGSTKLLSFTAKTIPVQQKEQPVMPTLNTEQTTTPDNKGGDSKLWIIGIVVGVLAGVGIVYLLFRKFIFNKYILPKIYARRQQKVVEQWKRDDREEAEGLARKQQEREEKQNNKNDNNQGGDE